MTYDEFRAELKSLGLTNVDFAKIIGFQVKTFTSWKNNSIPSWVEPFLHYYKKAKEFEAFKANFKIG